ncbi:MAG: ABC transporter permease [Patescibacteria group bacterium]
MSRFIKTTWVIWYRDLLRFWRNKVRVFGGLTFPVLWLLIFGNGLSASLSLPVPGVEFTDFLFPGIIAQFLIFMAMFGAISILQDREFGFLKEILVSPVPRSSIALGKILGGASIALLQALPIILMAPLAGISISLDLAGNLLPPMILFALILSAIGVAITSRLKSLDAGQYVFQFITFPLVMLSGAFFPLRNLPAWLDILTKINPLSYGVDLLRRISFEYSGLPTEAITALSPTINGNIVPIYLEYAVMAIFGIILIVFASRSFNK